MSSRPARAAQTLCVYWGGGEGSTTQSREGSVRSSSEGVRKGVKPSALGLSLPNHAASLG